MTYQRPPRSSDIRTFIPYLIGGLAVIAVLAFAFWPSSAPQNTHAVQQQSGQANERRQNENHVAMIG